MVVADRLSDVLSEFARTLASDFPIQHILDHLVDRIVQVLPIDAAGVTLISPRSDPHYIAASDERALRYERLQTELGQGPCLAAYETDEAILIQDLAEDDRFPLFAQRALTEGLVAVFTFPLRDGAAGLGALDLYRDTPGPLSDLEIATAQTLADVAAAYLRNAQVRVDLQAASAAEHEALERLRLVDLARTEFLTTVIHELRTPMTSISGYAELLHEEDSGALNPTQHQLVEAIERNSERLATLANDLLALARLDQEGVRPRLTDVDLGQVVLDARSSMQALLDERNLEVTFDVPATPVVVSGDARALERLVSNLMTNALKFTDDSGSVSCSLHVDDGRARLQVSDTGIGIPEAEQSLLFTRFFRASTARGYAKGSGLGLSIVQAVARTHGGTVSVTSAQDQGATFVVALPLRAAV